MPAEVLPRLVVLEVIDGRGLIATELDQLWANSSAEDVLHRHEGDSVGA
jgi:hypothetical protein